MYRFVCVIVCRLPYVVRFLLQNQQLLLQIKNITLMLDS